MSDSLKTLIGFINHYAPFNQMDDQDLGYLLENCVLSYFPSGTEILSPAHGKVEHFYILKQGEVRGERTALPQENANTTFVIGPGDCFPMAALVGERATRTTHITTQDTFCLVCAKSIFVELFTRSSAFRDFCLRGISSLLDVVNRQIQSQAQVALSDHFSLDTSLLTLSRRRPVMCSPDTAIREAVRRMHEQGVGSIVIAGEDAIPRGIFTLRDLRRIVADPRISLEGPIASVMANNPVGLPAGATAFEAALTMAKHHFAHILLLENNRCVGVISERDLFSLQRVNLVHIARTMANAPSVAALADMQDEVGRLAETLIAHGASADQINRLITLLNDYTTRQVIRLTLKTQHTSDIQFSWLSFGSAGRKEQTLLTDQDNGIVFVSGTDPDISRQRLMPLAKQINDALAQCGFALCPGNIMASNPQLCRSQPEWHQWFERFIDAATPQNLLNSCIYFDLRVQWGDTSLLEQTWLAISERLRQNTLFQRMLAETALQRRPPLGLFSHFVTQKSGGIKGIDLKKEGLSPFVDAARVLALAHGISETNTLSRLRGLEAAGVLESPDVNAWVEAYQFIQLLRLRWQLDALREKRPPSNLVAPESLNPLDQRILKEAFRQAQRLQRKLAWSYQL